MFKIVLASLVSLVTSVAFANDPYQERALAIQAQYGEFFDKMSGLSMTAVSRCDSATGLELGGPSHGEACLIIGIAGADNVSAAQKVFGATFRLHGIWVNIIAHGRSQPEPSVTIRN